MSSMPENYAEMDEVALCRALRQRYGFNVDEKLNDKDFLQKALDEDDGLLHELLHKMAMAPY